MNALGLLQPSQEMTPAVAFRVFHINKREAWLRGAPCQQLCNP